MSASWPLQKALYAHLSAETDLAEAIGAPPRLYDDPPPGTATPYLVIGEGRQSPLPGHDGAFEHDVRIRIVSRHGGRREVKTLIDLLVAALDGASFGIDGHRLVSCRFVFADVFRREADLYAGIARFRAVTEAEA